MNDRQRTWPRRSNVNADPAGGYSTNFYTGRLRPEVQLLTSQLYTIFHEKCTLYVYLLLTNGSPFIYLSYLELCMHPF